MNTITKKTPYLNILVSISISMIDENKNSKRKLTPIIIKHSFLLSFTLLLKEEPSMRTRVTVRKYRMPLTEVTSA